MSFKNTLFNYEKTYYLTVELFDTWILKMGKWPLKAWGSTEPVLGMRTEHATYDGDLMSVR